MFVLDIEEDQEVIDEKRIHIVSLNGSNAIWLLTGVKEGSMFKLTNYKEIDSRYSFTQDFQFATFKEQKTLIGSKVIDCNYIYFCTSVLVGSASDSSKVFI